ncbi:MAG: TetR/AcrR family transcriptional regulator [Lachnospiraceae bacterium]|nr:TetR/AcrR family transcriptional regulator [Lachnospiraceae bacterium]
MGKITGREALTELPAKVIALYRAVIALIEEGADIAELKVSDITEKAGIGKGTAYDYFDTKEEIIAYALLFFMENSMARLEEQIWEKNRFEEKVDLTLDIMSTEMGKGACMLRFINLLYEPSQAGQTLRSALQEAKVLNRCRPLLLLRDILERGIAGGEIRSDVPLNCLVYSLVTRFVSYVAFLLGQNEESGCCLSVEKEGITDEQRLSGEAFKAYISKCIMEEFRVRT